MKQKLTALWASLPHFIQAAIVAFVGGAGAEIGRIAGQWPNVCITGVCLKQDIGLIVGAGFVAARAFYMLPNRGLPAQGQAAAQKQISQ